MWNQGDDRNNDLFVTTATIDGKVYDLPLYRGQMMGRGWGRGPTDGRGMGYGGMMGGHGLVGVRRRCQSRERGERPRAGSSRSGRLSLNGMKRMTRDMRLLFSSFAFLFAGLAVLSALFIQGQSRRSRILLEYETDRTADLSWIPSDQRAQSIRRFSTPNRGLWHLWAFGRADHRPRRRAFHDDRFRHGVRVPLRARGRFAHPRARVGDARPRDDGRGRLPHGDDARWHACTRCRICNLRRALSPVRAGGWYGAQRLFTAATVLVPLAVVGIAAWFFAQRS